MVPPTKTFLLVALTVFTVLLSQGTAEISQCFKNGLPEVEDLDFSSGVSRFSFQLFRRLAEHVHGSGENLFISPFSVWSTLVLAFLGSRGGTKQELDRVLRLSSRGRTYANWKYLEDMLANNSSSTSGARFITINRGYFSDELDLEQCLESSLFELEVLNFKDATRSASTVNAVVEDTTEGKIKDFLDPSLLSRANFILLNAIYFKGMWQSQFEERDTAQTPFRVASGKEEMVMMMSQEGEFLYANTTTLKASVIELPYANSTYSMYLLLPTSEAEGTQEVVRNLNKRNLDEAIASLKATTMRVRLPKFSLTSKIQNALMTTLVQMGVKDLFSQRANLSGFTTSQPLSVDETVHKATIEVTEEGTVAAASTGFIGVRIVQRQFACDRPFVFLIMEKETGLPVMTGIYNTPPSA